MNPVEIHTKTTENEKLWKKENGSLVQISSLSDEELVKARKLSAEMLDKNYNKKQRAMLQVKKYTDLSDLFGNLLEQLDEELVKRKDEYSQKVNLLLKAEAEV